MTSESVRNEDLKPGDVVRIWGWGGAVTITRIAPYRGPLAAIIFALADASPGCGFSLERGGYTDRIVVDRK